MVESILKPKMMETIKLEPDWQGMFKFAVQLVIDNMPKSKGQTVVIEMLEYGQRLDADAKEKEENNV